MERCNPLFEQIVSCLLDFNLNVMVYDLCGYIVKTRKHLTACEACKKLVRCNELDLPKDFTADQYTAMISHGYLVYVTVPFFETIRIVELVISHILKISITFTWKIHLKFVVTKFLSHILFHSSVKNTESTI